MNELQRLMHTQTKLKLEVEAFRQALRAMYDIGGVLCEDWTDENKAVYEAAKENAERKLGLIRPYLTWRETYALIAQTQREYENDEVIQS
jgi:hypothetical protein